MKMKWLFSLLFISNLCWGSNQLVVDIISSENFSQRYEHFLAGRDVLDVDSFFPTTKGSHIEIIEMVLLQQALFLGGETRKVVFNPKPSVNILEFSDLIAGESLILARSVWHKISWTIAAHYLSQIRLLKLEITKLGFTSPSVTSHCSKRRFHSFGS